MDLQTKEIRKTIQLDVESIGYELLDMELSYRPRSTKITAYIDHKSGINIEDCIAVSKLISMTLDQGIFPEETYSLEVSSPGLNRKLILKEHYDKYIGKIIKLKLKNKMNNRKNYKGELIERIDNTITIAQDNHKINIKLDAIDICRLVPNFNKEEHYR
jgi:ribosome maturation factor RimP